jgi:catechol 2,3-dioxygenase-like lactoylglutathione lyase family enzyme
MIIGLHHLGIVVPDLDRARTFYEKMLGFELVMEESWQAPDELYDQGTGLKNSAARGYIMKGANCYLELWQYISPISSEDPTEYCANDHGLRHLCFEVDDVTAEWERLKNLGGTPMNPPVFFDDEGNGAVYCRDPFGNLIEFTTAGVGYPSLHGLAAIGRLPGFAGLEE